jgi:hypothetical protein
MEKKSKCYKFTMMKLIFVTTFLLSTPCFAMLGEFDNGRCEILHFQAEQRCVELVCGDTDRETVADCRDRGEFLQVMSRCQPQLLISMQNDYNKMSANRVPSCSRYHYKPKF